MSASETIKEKRQQAAKLVDEVRSIVAKLKDDQELMNTLSKEIKVKDKEYTRISAKLNELSSTLNDTYQKIQNERDQIVGQLYEAEQFYKNKYLPLVKKIDDPTTGFRVKIKAFSTTERTLNRISGICNQKYDEVKSSTANFKKQIIQLNSVIKRIENIEIKAGNTRKSIDTIHNNVIEIKKKITQAFSNVQKDQDSSKKLLSQIETVKIESDNKLLEIANTQEMAEERLNSIKQIYEIAHETGLSGEFERIRNQHKIEKQKWGYYVFYTSLTLLILLIGFYVSQLALYKFNLEDITFDINFYARYLILSPVVYYLYFAATQYAKERRLYEKYSFKTTLAMSIKSHIELLLSNSRFQTDTNTDRIIEFVLNGFNIIYNEPYENSDFNLKLKLTDIELNLQKKILEQLGLEKLNPNK